MSERHKSRFKASPTLIASCPSGPWQRANMGPSRSSAFADQSSAAENPGPGSACLGLQALPGECLCPPLPSNSKQPQLQAGRHPSHLYHSIPVHISIPLTPVRDMSSQLPCRAITCGFGNSWYRVDCPTIRIALPLPPSKPPGRL